MHSRQPRNCAKAWLTILGIEYPLTHSLARLVQLIGNRDSAALRFEDMHAFSPLPVTFAMRALHESSRGWIERRLSLVSMT